MQGDRNLVGISCKINHWVSRNGKYAPVIARMGVHVKCVCPPQNSIIIQHNSQNVDDDIELLKPLLENKAEFSYARQLPNEDCNVIERFTRSFNYPEESCIKSKDDLERLQIKTYFFSNVCAAYKRDTYDALGGFTDGAIFNEDMYLAAAAVHGGYRIAYCADAKVFHSHNYSNVMQLKRNFDNGVSQAMRPDLFEHISSTGEGKKMVKQTMEYLKEQKKAHLIPKLIVSSGFKYIGFKLGINYKKLPHRFVLKCTLNKEFWMKQSIRTAAEKIDPHRGYGMSEDERK